MKHLLIAVLFFIGIQSASAAVSIGKPAPEFTLTDSEGKAHKLSDFKGKVVILEWYNPECPFVKKHYGGGNMQKLQKTYTSKDNVVWLTINSSSEGKQGHLTAEQAQETKKSADMGSTALLLDPKSEVAKLYDAKTTPHMFVINPKGLLVYNGAIDDNDSANPRVIAGSKNYVAAAVNSTLKGEKVAKASTTPYGCGIKFP